MPIVSCFKRLGMHSHTLKPTILIINLETLVWFSPPQCWFGIAVISVLQNKVGSTSGKEQTAKQLVFFSKSVKKSVERGVRVLRARGAWASHTRRAYEAREKKRIFSISPQSHSPFSASFQTCCLTARAYLNTQKYGLFCSLGKERGTFEWEQRCEEWM